MNQRPKNTILALSACMLAASSGCAARVASNSGGHTSRCATASNACNPNDSFVTCPDLQPADSGTYDSPRAAPQLANIALFGIVDGAPYTDNDDPTENLRQVSFATEGSDTDPSVSSDGGRVYFSSTAHRATPDIYVKSFDGRALTQLTNDPASDIMPAVSPDGSRIAFASDRSGSWDLYVMSAAGGQAVQVTNDATHELHPTWSPDGRTLAFCKLGEVSGRWEIWVTDAEQAGVQKFLTLGLFPDWHPASNKILFQRSRDRGDRLFSVWTLDYTKGEATNLTEIVSNPSQALINPKWSPDGEYVAFAGVPNPSRTMLDSPPESADIWIMNVKGGGLSNLTGGRFTNLMPTWGPNRSICFVSNRGGQENLWSVNPETAMAAAMNRGGRPTVGAATSFPAPQSFPLNAHAAPMQNTTPMAHSMPPNAANNAANKMTKPATQQAAAPASATPAPAQMEPDPQPEMANVPNDDQDH